MLDNDKIDSLLHNYNNNVGNAAVYMKVETWIILENNCPFSDSHKSTNIFPQKPIFLIVLLSFFYIFAFDYPYTDCFHGIFYIF